MAGDAENLRIRALREQIESTLNVLPRHLRANTRPDKTIPIEPALSSVEVDLAFMRYAPDQPSRIEGGEVIIIEDSDDEAEMVKERDELVVISDEEKSEPEERVRKRLKLDHKVKAKDLAMLEHCVVKEGQENVDIGPGMTSAEMDDHAESIACKPKPKHVGSYEDGTSSEGDESSDEAVKNKDDKSQIDNHLPPNLVFGQTRQMETSVTVSENEDIVKEEQREILYKPATKTVLGGSRKSRKQGKKYKNRSKPMTSTELLENLANGVKNYEKHGTGNLPETMSVLEKVAARRQRKLDRGEQLPGTLDMFQGVAGFDKEVQASSGGGQFGDDFVSFGDTKEIFEEPTQRRTMEELPPVTGAKRDCLFVSYNNLDSMEPQQGLRVYDNAASKVEGGVRTKKRRRPA